MKIENRLIIERAVGIIEGIASTLPEKHNDALLRVCEMIDAALFKEEEK